MDQTGIRGNAAARGRTPDSLIPALKAIANPVRLQILVWLKEPRANFPMDNVIADPDEYGICVTQIQTKTGLAQPTVSNHMSVLERAGLVISTRVRQWTHYRRNEANLAKLVSELGNTIGE
ncbi:ArsR/SmtB family transcription factor [Bifidobacterium tibiigranuli]|jgi:ArsR family transcriptional regulator|uniref:ArsR/SmtB family transcription factor n=1 Tax=Bifidobacterium tibiigranuli TaxID=2172043 RepID=UPI0026EEA3CC|nr:metalloregulator ArsR/SmtB family transcription factor [Bifidobacterium tibiigranuli]MCI1649252.1 helix-turn-helix domain-containing protein [Bifidobacterium tibiigranuli]MCI2185821.1 helix-turn-helix domain-containing protein [Bifidobacterium tibiigranuli]MCI2203132.1 helix-turn-helix domain-containing protein [Bifidobacterium tibiigranuli]